MLRPRQEFTQTCERCNPPHEGRSVNGGRAVTGFFHRMGGRRTVPAPAGNDVQMPTGLQGWDVDMEDCPTAVESDDDSDDDSDADSDATFDAGWNDGFDGDFHVASEHREHLIAAESELNPAQRLTQEQEHVDSQRRLFQQHAENQRLFELAQEQNSRQRADLQREQQQLDELRAAHRRLEEEVDRGQVRLQELRGTKRRLEQDVDHGREHVNNLRRTRRRIEE